MQRAQKYQRRTMAYELKNFENIQTDVFELGNGQFTTLHSNSHAYQDDV